MTRRVTSLRWTLVRNLVSNFSGKTRGLVTGKSRPTGSLRSRFLQKLFDNNSEREALQTIYAALQLQYGQVEEKLQTLYSSIEPAIDSHGRPQGETEKELKINHEIIELDNETEDAEIERREKEVRLASQFVNGMTWFAKRAGFKACSIEDEMYAKKNHYRLTTPMKIDWSYFDDSILEKCDLYRRRYSSIKPPSFSGRALILFRGSGKDSTTGFYYTEKFDELTTRIAQKSYLSVMNKIRSALGMEKFTEQATFIQTNAVSVWSRIKFTIESQIHAMTGSTKTVQHPVQKKGTSRSAVNIDQREKGESNLTNSVTNNNALSEIEFNFSNLFGKIVLEEETFNDAIVLYGTTGYPDPDIRQKNDYKKYVSVRHFRHVPRCDMEFVLPDNAQKVYMRPVDRVFLAMSIIGGTGVASTVYFTGVALTKPGIVAMTALGAYVVRIFNRYRMSKFYYRSALAQYLNSNTTGKDRSVVYIVTKEARDNDFVAIASVLNAAWEYKNDQTSLKNLFENHFNDEKANSSEPMEKEVNFDELYSRAKEYFSMAESTRHDEGLNKHTFNNSIRWLSRMGILEVNKDRNTVSTMKSCGEIIGMKKELLASSLDEEICLHALNAGFLKVPEYSGPE